MLPIKHLSARVPWHDKKWDGSICENPADNSFCRVLPMIDISKDVETECSHCGIAFSELDVLPPCISEKGAFLSTNGFKRQTEHAYKRYGNENFAQFLPATLIHKPFSFNAVPFKWMLKDRDTHFNELAERYELNYSAQLEEDLCKPLFGNYRPSWVQHRENQRELLNSFFGCLKPRKSLVFFYAKHTPLSETNVKVLIGAAYITNVGELIDYEYPKGYTGHRSFVWDRIIQHSLKNPDDGCILPLHELADYELSNPDNSETVRACIAVAPNHEQFSHASELVENDVAIDALFAMQTSLKRAAEILQADYSSQLEWIDNAISMVWNMRGAFPSMGSVLTASKFENGNALAWNIDQYIIDNYDDIYGADAWQILENVINGSISIKGIKITKTMQTLWTRAFSDADKIKMRLVSRIQMNNEQAEYALGCKDILENPYRLFEVSRRDSVYIPFIAIDKAMYPAPVISEKFPLTEVPPFDDQLDIRRIRALISFVLEDYADIGNTLMTEGDLINIIHEITLSAPVPVTSKLLEGFSNEDFFCDIFIRIVSEDDSQTVFFKLIRLNNVKTKILSMLNFNVIEKRIHKIDADFNIYLDKAIGFACKPDDEFDIKSRKEKTEAMAVLAKYRVSVLVGPAGSGKTTLLKAFCSIPEISSDGILLLAPTGKARVKLDEKALTVAQFLYKSSRYDIFTGQYRINPEAPKSVYGTVIIDEASMLTEEQLAAVIDAVTAKRFILVGDYRQLPPIGAGRPFFDIVHKMKQLNMACAELTNVSRQKNVFDKSRKDVALSKFYGEATKEDYESILELISEINSGNSGDIELIRWDNSDELKNHLINTLEKSLNINMADKEGSFEDKALGRVKGIFFNYGSSEKEIERWQIISPVNGHAHGVKEINKTIQQTFRKGTIKKALEKWSPIPEPQGRDSFVYGDKVINLGNRTVKTIQPYGAKGLNYMANGEIGIVVGQWSSKQKPYVWIAFSSQPGYAYSFKQGQFDEGENSYDFELAYCISVHKSQGSGFGITFLVLPANNPLLSRELLYTALTRQEDKVIILHQGEFNNFLKYASEEYSETARRLTDLFETPVIQVYKQKSYDSRYVNITQKGEPVISKSEALIANILFSYERQGLLTYAYENKLDLSTGRTIKPDFTIEHPSTGRKFYWEHLGLLDTPDYKRKWEFKKQAYLSEGFVPAENATIEDDYILITSEDFPGGGFNSQEVDKLINKYILNI